MTKKKREKEKPLESDKGAGILSITSFISIIPKLELLSDMWLPGASSSTKHGAGCLLSAELLQDVLFGKLIINFLVLPIST